MTIQIKMLFLMSTLIGLASAFAQTAQSSREHLTTIPPTRIGKHQINETIQQWYEQEPQALEDSRAASKSPSPHRLGETFSEWLKINQMDLDRTCQNHKRSDTALCKRLLATRDSGSGDYYTNDQYKRAFGWRFTGGVMTAYTLDKGKTWHTVLAPDLGPVNKEFVTTTTDRIYTWKFVNGKLSSVLITPDWERRGNIGTTIHSGIVPAFLGEIKFLTQVYGTPASAKAVSYHNAFGARWERSEIAWITPDGTQIVAFERTEFDQQGQLAAVSFRSKEALEAPELTKPNPYKQ